MQGMFHVHTTYSDGDNSIKEMVEASQNMGLQYTVISDHTKKPWAKTAGLSRKKMSRYISECHKAGAVAGIECDVLEDGSLAEPENLLQKFDVVFASIHRFDLHPGEQTARVTKALKHKTVNIFAHPIGTHKERYLGADAVDVDKVLMLCKNRGIAIELNGRKFSREIMDSGLARRANDFGLFFVCGSDAHCVQELGDIQYALAVADEIGIPEHRLLNNWSKEEFLSWCG